MYSGCLLNVPVLPAWGGLKGADSVFPLRVLLTAGPNGTYCTVQSRQGSMSYRIMCLSCA